MVEYCDRFDSQASAPLERLQLKIKYRSRFSYESRDLDHWTRITALPKFGPPLTMFFPCFLTLLLLTTLVVAADLYKILGCALSEYPLMFLLTPFSAQ